MKSSALQNDFTGIETIDANWTTRAFFSRFSNVNFKILDLIRVSNKCLQQNKDNKGPIIKIYFLQQMALKCNRNKLSRERSYKYEEKIT